MPVSSAVGSSRRWRSGTDAPRLLAAGSVTMLVSYRQPLDHRQPLRVGWARYCRLWVDHHADLLRARTRPVWGPIAGAASEVAWVVRLTAGSAAARPKLLQ